MVRGRRTPPEKKARAAAEILTGATLPQVAQCTDISLRTVTRIKAELARGGLLNAEDYEALVGEYLAENLIATTNHVRLFGDERWLADTDADKIQAIAILHGILQDKATRILGAWRRVNPGPGEPGPPAIDGAAERVG